MADQKKNIKPLIKGRNITFRPLLCLPFIISSFSAYSFSVTLVNDTIIIDGHAVIIEVEEEIDTLEKSIETSKEFLEWFQAAAGYEQGLSAIQSNGDLQTVDEFTGVKIRPDQFALSFHAAIQLDEKRSLVSGLEFIYSSWEQASFDETQLDDSLIGFLNPSEGRLDQLIFWSFGELGGETFVESVNPEQRTFSSFAIRMPINIIQELEWNKYNSIEIQAGFTGEYRMINSVQKLVLIDSDANQNYVQIDELEKNGIIVYANFGLSYLKSISKNQSLGIRFQGLYPINALKFGEESLEFIPSFIGIHGFLRYFLN